MERADEFRTTDNERAYCDEARASAKRRHPSARREAPSGEATTGTLRGTPEGDDLAKRFHQAGLRELEIENG